MTRERRVASSLPARQPASSGRPVVPRILTLHWSFARSQVEVVGSKGSVKTVQTGYEVMGCGSGGIQGEQHTTNDMVLAVLTDWVNVCRSGRPASVPVADGLLTLQGCFAARDSAQRAQPVDLPSVC